MLWVAYAVVAHVGNALVFVADKTLLGSDTAVGSPAKFAAYSGLAAALVGVLLPFAFAVPTVSVVGWSLLGGVFWVVALWLFFEGLDQGEASRVVPIAGSIVPLFTLVLATVFLGEVLSVRELVAVGALIVGGALLSISLGGSRGLSRVALLATMGSGAAFAAHFAVVDALYDSFEPFLAGFAYARIGVGVASLGLLVLLVLSGRWRTGDEQRTARRRDTAWFVTAWFVGSKVLGAGALALQNYAISLGSVTVVNALQGTQYVFLLLFAVVVSRWWPRLFAEEVARVALGQKIAGIVLVSGGLIALLG